jgi:hypothetical protein
MKVEFNLDEIQQMFDCVVDQLVAVDLDKHDRAALRRWRSQTMTPTSAGMQLLAEKINAELQRTHDRSEVSAIKKPDWAR